MVVSIERESLIFLLRFFNNSAFKVHGTKPWDLTGDIVAIYRVIKEFDVFNLGAQFHCVLSGLKIFDGGDGISILQRIAIGI